MFPRISNYGITNLTNWIILVFILYTLNSKYSLGFPNNFYRQCDINIQNSFANCSKRGLAEVPQGLEGYKNICLAFNELRTIDATDLYEAREAIQLSLKHNIIEIIARNAFDNMKDLKILDLSDNRLSYLSDNQFENNKKLNYLSLKGNSIVFQISTIVSNSLEFLDLSYCEISNLNFNSMLNLPNLKVLLLHNNPISNLVNIQAIETMPHLHFLSMNPCQLGYFNEFRTYLNRHKIYHSEVRICGEWNFNGNKEPLGEDKEDRFYTESNENTPETFYHKLYYYHTGKAKLVCFIIFFVVMSMVISCLIYVLFRRISRNSVRRPTPPVPSAPPTQTTVTPKEDMPLYKSMLKFLMFGVPHGQKENSIQSNTTEVKVENIAEMVKQSDNKKY